MSQKYQNKIKVFGIDARFYGPVGKGLGRYTKEIVDRILAFDQVNNYVIFLSLDNYADFKILRSNVKKVLIKSRWYTLREQFELPLKIYQEKIDLMHFPHFNVPIFCPTKYIVTIHDLILTRYATVRATTLGPIKYIFKNLGY
ncbi:MAG: hypothetical protein NT091_05185, partial [Candidatus Falkowbacteria bacterium]|nr:hypothetical protein [Candidatus Falkowbacteria bacterium]